MKFDSSIQRDGSRSRGTRSRSRRRRGGQAFVEFALFLLFVLPLLVGLVQIGMVLITMSGLSQISREGARYASSDGTSYYNGNGGGYTAFQTDVESYVENQVVANTNIPWTKISSCTVNAPTFAQGDPVTISISYNMSNQFFLPVIKGMTYGNLNKTDTFTTTMVLQ